MRILIISETYKKGGAGNATKNIYNFLKKKFSKKSDLKLVVPFEKTEDENILSYFNFLTYFKYIFFKLLNRFIAIFFSSNKFYFFNKFINISLFKVKKLQKILKYNEPEIVIILWYEYILNYNEILNIKNTFNSKIVFIPFDMYNFTGGCRYSQSCESYKNNCLACPAVSSFFSNLPNRNYKDNKNLISKINPEIIFPSSFAKKFTNETNILDKNIQTHLINYPISKYASTESQFIQNLKNKTKNKKIIFFGAQDLREWRKGAHNLINVLSNLKTRYPESYSNIIFVSVGKNAKNILSKFSKNSIFLESLKYDELIELYRYSSLIIIPSLQEWSSLMMSEAIKLDKVVFSFKTGSSYDLITNNVNGYVFSYYDYNKFADLINEFLFSPEKFFISDRAKYLEKIKKVISEEEILKKYKNVIGK